MVITRFTVEVHDQRNFRSRRGSSSPSVTKTATALAFDGLTVVRILRSQDQPPRYAVDYLRTLTRPSST